MRIDTQQLDVPALPAGATYVLECAGCGRKSLPISYEALLETARALTESRVFCSRCGE
jgi:trimethylamine:corrinoid methyltransferase-like protein